jgi:hypothetical protein
MFRVIGPIRHVEVIAIGNSIRMLAMLRMRYGGKRWRKMKGNATVETTDGRWRQAEIHWYEAHGIGQRRLKIKRFLD